MLMFCILLFCENANKSLEPCETDFHRLKDVKNNYFFASKRNETLEAKNKGSNIASFLS